VKRRDFFKRTAGLVAGAAVAQRLIEPSAPSYDVRTDTYTHRNYGYSFTVTPEMMDDDLMPWLKANQGLFNTAAARGSRVL